MQRKLKVEVIWKDDDVIRLIAAVEERKCLWNSYVQRTPEEKKNAWEEITMYFVSKKFEPFDLQAKWSNLRIQFHKSKAREKNNEEVIWRFYNIMKFLNMSDVKLDEDELPFQPINTMSYLVSKKKCILILFIKKCLSLVHERLGSY